MAKFYGYARVSTKDQSDNSLENQLRYLKIKAQELNLEFIGYKEKESGKSFSERPQLQKLLSDVKTGDYVGVYDNSRFGRDTQESLETVDSLIAKGVTVQISGQNFDANSPRERLVFTIESAISEFYRRDQNLKSRIGIDQKKQKGEWLFTSRLLGYRLTFQGNKPKVEIVEEEAEIIKYIFNEYARGKSLRKITQEINLKGYRTRVGKLFSDASVRRYIHKPIYKGYYKVEAAGGMKGQDRKRLDESTLVKSKYYPPIVSEELWDRVQKSYRTLRREHTMQFEYRYSYYELTSILKCYYCKKVGKATSYVHSFHKQKKSLRINSNYVDRIHRKGCTQTVYTFRGWVLESIFRMCFYLVFMNTSEVADFIEQKRNKVDLDTAAIQKDIQRIDKVIVGLDKEKTNLLDAVQKGLPYEDVHNRIADINRQRDDLLRHRAEIQNDYVDIEEQFENLYEEYSEAMLFNYIKAENHAHKREIYKELIQSAYVFNGQIVIRYTNTKLFIMSLRRNRGRIIQNDFDIKVHFMNKYQYTINFDASSDKAEIVDVPIKFRPTTENEDLWVKALHDRRSAELEALLNRVEEYTKIQLSD